MPSGPPGPAKESIRNVHKLKIYVYELPAWLNMPAEMDFYAGHERHDSIYSAYNLFYERLMSDWRARGTFRLLIPHRDARLVCPVRQHTIHRCMRTRLVQVCADGRSLRGEPFLHSGPVVRPRREYPHLRGLLAPGAELRADALSVLGRP